MVVPGKAVLNSARAGAPFRGAIAARITDIEGHTLRGLQSMVPVAVIDPDDGTRGLGEAEAAVHEMAVTDTFDHLKPLLLGQRPRCSLRNRSSYLRSWRLTWHCGAYGGMYWYCSLAPDLRRNRSSSTIASTPVGGQEADG